MRSLFTLATALLLMAPIQTNAQTYACGESCQAKKSGGMLSRLRDTVTLKSVRSRPQKSSNIGLVDYREDLDSASRQSSPAVQYRKLHRDGVAAIPSTLPVEVPDEEVNQVRFVDRATSPTGARLKSLGEDDRREKWNRITSLRSASADDEVGNSLDGIEDPAQRFRKPTQRSATVRTISTDDGSAPHAPSRATKNGQMTPEELAAYVRSRRQNSGRRWPWSR